MIEDNKRRVEQGSHNFLQPEFQRQVQLNRVQNNTHHFLSGEIQRRCANERIAKGSHNFLQRGRIVALNMETGIVSTILSDEYFKRKDIYCRPNSKAYKKWKEEHEH